MRLFSRRRATRPPAPVPVAEPVPGKSAFAAGGFLRARTPEPADPELRQFPVYSATIAECPPPGSGGTEDLGLGFVFIRRRPDTARDERWPSPTPAPYLPPAPEVLIYNAGPDTDLVEPRRLPEDECDTLTAVVRRGLPAFEPGCYEVRYDRLGPHGRRGGLPAPKPLTVAASTLNDLAQVIEEDAARILDDGRTLVALPDLQVMGGQIRVSGFTFGTFTLRALDAEEKRRLMLEDEDEPADDTGGPAAAAADPSGEQQEAGR